MATITGAVECIRLGDDIGFVRIREGSGDTETLLIWFSPSDPSAFTRVLHSMWVSILRDAITSNKTVTAITSSSSGAQILSLTLNE